jgi:hypothetical protein
MRPGRRTEVAGFAPPGLSASLIELFVTQWIT